MPVPLHITPTLYITPLIDMGSAELIEGYMQGVHWQLYGLRVHERMQTNLIEHLRELASESVQFHDDEQTWHYAIGCLLGELSGQLFPATPSSFGIGKHNAGNASRTTADTRLNAIKGSSASSYAPFPRVGIWLRTRC